eukprot:TRINITY_DN9491_c0_g1_i3.p1 TRINITY_DN9491_c0_g1~~TRINITY_DN9491_c0_g1_i3.p1  ORF type:complete len:591 (-),score=102.29 TRINITY_DN9491_c0_g1_i3:116-1888(-)
MSATSYRGHSVTLAYPSTVLSAASPPTRTVLSVRRPVSAAGRPERWSTAAASSLDSSRRSLGAPQQAPAPPQPLQAPRTLHGHASVGAPTDTNSRSLRSVVERQTAPLQDDTRPSEVERAAPAVIKTVSQDPPRSQREDRRLPTQAKEATPAVSITSRPVDVAAKLRQCHPLPSQRQVAGVRSPPPEVVPKPLDVLGSLRQCQSTDALAAVVITVCDEGSGCYRGDSRIWRLERRGPRRNTYVASYKMLLGAVPTLLDALNEDLEGEDCPQSGHDGACKSDLSQAAFADMLKLVMDIEAVEPANVAFDFECSRGGKWLATDAKGVDTPVGILDIVSSLIARGHMVTVSDEHLHALMQAWDRMHPFLGANPFVHLGMVAGPVVVRFDPFSLATCGSARLRSVAEVCGSGKAKVLGGRSGVSVFSVDFDLADREGLLQAEPPYDLHVLTVTTPTPGSEDDFPKLESSHACQIGGCRGAAGHVLLAFASGGALLASAGGWGRLGDAEPWRLPRLRGASEGRLLRALAASYGPDCLLQARKALDRWPIGGDARLRLAQHFALQYSELSVPCHDGGEWWSPLQASFGQSWQRQGI